jgi:hypothetical protein
MYADDHLIREADRLIISSRAVIARVSELLAKAAEVDISGDRAVPNQVDPEPPTSPQSAA